MNIFKIFDGLQFNNDCTFNQQIEAMLTNFHTSIFYNNFDLLLNLQPHLMQCDDQSILVDRLKETGTQLSMNLNSCGADFPGQLFIC